MRIIIYLDDSNKTAGRSLYLLLAEAVEIEWAPCPRSAAANHSLIVDRSPSIWFQLIKHNFSIERQTLFHRASTIPKNSPEQEWTSTISPSEIPDFSQWYLQCALINWFETQQPTNLQLPQSRTGNRRYRQLRPIFYFISTSKKCRDNRAQNVKMHHVAVRLHRNYLNQGFLTGGPWTIWGSINVF